MASAEISTLLYQRLGISKRPEPESLVKGTTQDLCRDYNLRAIQALTLKPVLEVVERNLPTLIRERDKWSSARVGSEMHRLFRVWEGYRIFLHEIQPSIPGEPIYHFHPSPMIIHVLDGTYEMGIGGGPTNMLPPPIVCRLELEGDFVYEMTHENGWHYTRALHDKPTYSIAVTTKEWRNPIPFAPKIDIKYLTQQEEERMFDKFSSLFPLVAGEMNT